MKKRLFTLVLTGVMVLSLVACGGKDEKETGTSATSTDSKEEETKEVVEEDKSDAS